MKPFVSILLLVLIQPLLLTGQRLRILMAGEPVRFAVVLLSDGESLLSDQQGFVTVPQGIHHIEISCSGCTKTVVSHPFPEQIMVEPQMSVAGNAVIVLGTAEKPSEHESHAMEQRVAGLTGATLVRRGAFAGDIAVRGLDDQRTAVRLNGMAVFKACVDKMDPVFAYVETANLESITLNKGGLDLAGLDGKEASINLKTRKPDGSRFSVKAESGFRAPDTYRFASVSTDGSSGIHAFRVSATAKQAADFYTSNLRKIPGSSYRKQNVSIASTHARRPEMEWSTFFLYDLAEDAGYPALLMDARKATAVMGQIGWRAAPQGSFFDETDGSFYFNRIVHLMDDYDRDVTARDVMKNMFMPMKGETSTAGFRNSWKRQRQNWKSSVGIDAFSSKAYGDMRMTSIFPEVKPMFLYNLENIQTRQGAIYASLQRTFGTKALLGGSLSLTSVYINPEQSSTTAYFEGLYEKKQPGSIRVLPALSIYGTGFSGDHFSVSSSARLTYRAPTHIERFGHYIFNYTDGFFYEGNPWLRSECTIHLEASVQYQKKETGVSVTVFNKNIRNYISGTGETEFSEGFFRFRTYENVGTAQFSGLEAEMSLRLFADLTWKGQFSFVRAELLESGDPLPFIPPLEISNGFRFKHKTFTHRLDIQWNAPQNRVSTLLANEDATGAFVQVNAVSSFTPLKGVQILLEIQNLTDARIVRHTSVNNLPDPGRTLQLTASVQF